MHIEEGDTFYIKEDTDFTKFGDGSLTGAPEDVMAEWATYKNQTLICSKAFYAHERRFIRISNGTVFDASWCEKIESPQ